MIAVVRLRGNIKVNYRISTALELLRIRKVNHCIILRDSKDAIGVLKRVKDYTTFGEVSDEVVKLMIEKRGRKVGGKRLDKADIPKMFKLLGEPKKLIEAGFKPVFRLRPARKGLKSVKKQFPQGDLGNRGKEMTKLLERMI